ncbi:MAG TPA: efflux RND transporter permease subunit [Anaeromyxobacteraceae bacterium]|nr:efflux RND transporter permease subunit [Anaeromyxobacteraceae bacterium]
MNPSRPFIERPVATALLMVAVFLAGAAAYTQLPVSALPQVDYPTIQVLTFYPGASPEVMETTVTAPLERQLGQLQGLNQMTSTSSGATSVIVLQFVLSLDIDVAEQEVQSAINAAQSYLPANLPTPPIYSKINPADTPVLTLAVTSDSMPLSRVEDLVDTRLAPRLSQLSGVGLVSISGGQKPAVRVQANPAALAAYGINLEQVRTALTQASVNAAKGNFDGPRQNYQIDANDQLTRSTDYRDIVVAYSNGTAVMLKDVANVIDGVEDVKLAGWMDTKPAVIVNIRRQPGANTISVVKSIKTVLPRLRAAFPASVEITPLTDLTVPIEASIADVQFELFLTVSLVVMVIFLFLRSVPATVIPGVAVPISLVGTFAAMYLLGYSLDNLSMMALTIATGFVVDDAIVMIENISRYLEEGDSPMQAALKGAQQIGFTILSLTVSLVAVLIPLLFMGDVVGRLFREFAVTLAVTIVISAAVSLTLTPMMCSRILRRQHPEQQGRFYRATERSFQRMIGFYGRTLKVVLRHEKLTLLVAAATLILTVLLYVFIPKGFFPDQDTGVIQGISQAPESISFQAMAERQQALARVILEDPAVQSLSSFIGADGTNTTLNSGRMSINLKPLAERRMSAAAVIRRLRTALEHLQGIRLFMQPVQNITVDDRVARTQFQYTLEDADAAELSTWTTRLVRELEQRPELEDVATDQQPDGLAIFVSIDRATASRIGVAPSSIDNTLYDVFGQRQISTLYTQLNQYHLVLEAQPLFQSDPANLQTLYVQANSTASAVNPVGTTSFAASSSSSAGSNAVTTPVAYTPSSGALASLPTVLAPSPAPIASASKAPQAIQLAAVTQVESRKAPLSITHQGQFPAVTVSFNLAPGASLESAIEAIHQVEQGLHLPPSVQARFQGTAAAFESASSGEILLLLAALATVYIVLGVLYESFIHPVTILSTLFSAGVGALLALMAFREDLGVIAVIGIILLIGIVKKNGIMMVDFALDAERKGNKNPTDAIYEACLLRFRPIMMTTLAALLAGIPLAAGTGMGSELRRPLGIAMIGGLLLSQALTLYTTPVIYIFFDRLAQRFARWRSDLSSSRAP